MSYSKDVYVGCYIECKNELIDNYIEVKMCCLTQYSIDDKFCNNLVKEKI